MRVHATELRRKLAQYYSNGHKHDLRIDLPVGSYVPDFHWGQLNGSTARSFWIQTRKLSWIVGTLLAIGIAIYATKAYVDRLLQKLQSASVVEKFWGANSPQPQPVMLCVRTSVVYGISQRVYDKYEASHHTEQVPNLEAVILSPTQALEGSDVFPIRNQYVGVGAAKALARLTALFNHLGKPTQARAGEGFAFADIRNFPSVLVGALSNPWTLDMTRDLEFSFVREGSKYGIKDRRKGRRHLVDPGLEGRKNRSGFCHRLALPPSSYRRTSLHPGMGNAIRDVPAGEFLTNEKYMSEALRNAPSG